MEMSIAASARETVPSETAVMGSEDVIATLNAVIEGDYTLRLKDTGVLNSTINRLISQLEKDTSTGMDRTVSLSINACETTMLSARMKAQLHSVDVQSQTVATGADELQSSINNINRYGEEIVSDVRDTRERIRTSSQAASETVVTMDKISSSVEQTMSKVHSLEALSKEISDVAETIKGIAFQTNLLSLNANVEAAKAGDAGRGFAVVAKEVGALAGRSSKATKAIDELVRSTHSEIAQIIQSMSDSAQSVNQGQEAITLLENALATARDRIEHVEESADQIAHTLNEQSEAVQVVASGISDIARATESTSTGATEMATSMQDIEKSVSTYLDRLAKKSVRNKILKLAQSDHIRWKKQLVNMAAGLEPLSVHELSDHRGCRLGKWYNQVSDPKLLNSEAFQYLRAPHEKVHHHGRLAAEFFNAGKKEAALREIQVVEEASEEVLQVLSWLDENYAG